jgi:proton-translocating NADH-quinone oxidoreductase chain N
MINLPYFVWLIAFPMMASPLVYLMGRIQPRGNLLSRWTAVAVLVATWIPFVLAAQAFRAEGAAVYTLGSITLRFDGLSLLLAAVVLTLATLVSLYSGVYMSAELGAEKYHAMLVIMSAAMIGLGCAADLFNLWLWFETMAIASYLLVAFYREQKASLEAGVKYLVQSATGSVFVLLGVALIFAQTGALDLVEIHAILASGSAPGLPLLAAGALFVIGFGVKIALVPLHTWLPDAHAQAPSGISAMLSAVVIESGLVALLRTLTVLAGAAVAWGELLMLFGALNMIVGNLLALRQQQVKRLLAFSSISHIGYMLLGLGIALYSGALTGAQGGFFHLLSHGLMKGLAFLSAGALLYVLHIAASHDAEHSPLTISDLAGAAQRYPLAALVLSIAVLGLGGLPPLVGFMSKWQILVAGFDTRNALIMGLVAFAALNSVLSLAYYAPLVNTIYREKPSTAVLQGRPIPLSMHVPLVVLATAVVVIGVWPSLVSWLTEPAGAALMALFGG